MKALNPKRGSATAQHLYAKAIAASDVSSEDKHGFIAGFFI